VSVLSYYHVLFSSDLDVLASLSYRCSLSRSVLTACLSVRLHLTSGFRCRLSFPQDIVTVPKENKKKNKKKRCLLFQAPRQSHNHLPPR